MKFYQLGFRYLQRKKGKTILLLIVLILVNSMILGTSMILRTTNESKQAMQEKTNSKIVAEITSKDSKITENEVNKIETLEDVSSINRIGRQEVFPNNFAPVTLNTSTNEENLKIALLSYDDLEKDSPFSEMQYRLASGDYIKREKKGAVINANLANQNELKVGDTIELSTENGTKVSVQIIGIFMSAGNAEKDQPSETTAVNRIENQIFIDNSTYKELFKEAEFEKICIYSKRPEKLDVLETSLQKIFGNDVELSTSDTLYQQMSAPLEQISKVANLMLVLTLVTGTVVVSLLLCMWMRTRQKEVAIFMSLGKTKSEIFLQTLLEAGSVFTLSVLGATAIGKLFSGVCKRHYRFRNSNRKSESGFADTRYWNVVPFRRCSYFGGIVLFHSSDITSKPKRYISKNGGIVHEFFWIGKAFCVQKARKKYSLIVDCFCNQYLASCRCGEQKCQY